MVKQLSLKKLVIPQGNDVYIRLFFGQAIELQQMLCMLGIALGGLQAWVHRYSLSSTDAISYIEIGEAYFRGDWNTAINTYWSPLYCWLLGLTFEIVHPAPEWEFPLVKFVNFCLYLAAIGSFNFFVNQLVCYYQEKTAQSEPNASPAVPNWIWMLAGYSLFYWITLRWIGLQTDTPDMGVVAILLLATGLLLRLKPTSSWSKFVAFGVSLAIGYFCKATMFPIALVLLGTLVIAVGGVRRSPLKKLAAISAFGIVIAPFVIAVSLSAGHLTFGEAGKLNYAWLVNPGGYNIPDQHWQGQPEGYGQPLHPTRKIFDQPAVFEFDGPIRGTYAPWYNPPYWFKGLKTSFNLRKQLAVVTRNFSRYTHLFLSPLVFGYLLLICICEDWNRSSLPPMVNWRLLIPAMTGLGMLLLVHASSRLMAPFVLLLFAAAFTSVRVPNSRETRRLLTGIVLCVFLIVSSKLSYSLVQDWVAMLRSSPNPPLLVARELQQLGVPSGSTIALLKVEDGSWARLGRFRIIAEIPDGDSFWAQPEAKQQQALEAVRQTGAVAIVTERRELPDPNAVLLGWQSLGPEYDAYIFE